MGPLSKPSRPTSICTGGSAAAISQPKTAALALSGRISYGEWLRRDVALWAGQPVGEVCRLLDENPFVPGAPELLRALKSSGVVVALVSAGFTLNTDPIAAEYGVDYVLANELIEEGGLLTGAAINHVPEGGKAAFVRSLVHRLGISADETMAAGDSRVDLELFDCRGSADRRQPGLTRPRRTRRRRLHARPARVCRLARHPRVS